MHFALYCMYNTFFLYIMMFGRLRPSLAGERLPLLGWPVLGDSRGPGQPRPESSPASALPPGGNVPLPSSPQAQGQAPRDHSDSLEPLELFTVAEAELVSLLCPAFPEGTPGEGQRLSLLLRLPPDRPPALLWPAWWPCPRLYTRECDHLCFRGLSCVCSSG